MESPIGIIPSLAVGRYSAMTGPGYEVRNVAVRSTDFDAFLGVILQRENDLADSKAKRPKGEAAAMEVASLAMDATKALKAENADPLAIAYLETAIARAIALLVDLKGKG